MGANVGQKWGQGQGPAFNKSGYGIPLDASWGIAQGRSFGASSLRGRPLPGAQFTGDYGAEPASVDFWARPGGGYRLASVLAAAHVCAGLLGAAAGALTWFFTQPAGVVPALAAIVGALVALAGAGAFELARSWGPRGAHAARVLLPAADLVAAGALFWLLKDPAQIVLLFMAPALMAALLLSWRSGAVSAAAIVAYFAGMNALRPGIPLEQWALETLALAGALTAIVLGVGMYAAALANVQTTLRADIALLRGQRETQAAEQQRLLETLNLLEDAQARLEHERVQVNQQIAEIASTTHRLADGDLSAIRVLQPGMFGPLEAVRAALGRLSLRLGLSARPQTLAPEALRAFETVLAASREQAHLLAETDAALQTLGAGANKLVAEVQVVERGSGELPGIDRRQLFQVLRAMEQRALAQASSTAMLSARLAQLRTHQSEIEAELRQLHRVNQITGSQLEWERSGLHLGTGENGEPRR